MITAAQLYKLAPKCQSAVIFADAINASMLKFGISSKESQAAFLAQVIHESGGLQVFSENLNYSAAALPAVFGQARFPPNLATQLGRTTSHPANQVLIANIAYANRMGNGPVDSGDGWRFRGRGPIQLTGRDNYTRCGDVIGPDLIGNPDLLLSPHWGCLSAGWFWAAGNRTGKPLAGDIDAISKIVNGGVNGLEERRALYEQALRVLA
jgi:putative chitinase